MREMTNRITNTEMVKSRLDWLYKTSGTSALITALLLLYAMINMITAVLLPGGVSGVKLPLQDNWLIVIFKLLAGFSGSQIDLLQVINPLDVAILALVGVTFFGLSAALRRTSKIWSTIALTLPFLGIILFIITRTAGRSVVMIAGIVISIVMLRNDSFNKGIAYMGIVASALLLVGDFTAGVVHSDIITTLFGTGYVLMMIWFFLIAGRLFLLSLSILKQGRQ
jgi:hypothetical protein